MVWSENTTLFLQHRKLRARSCHPQPSSMPQAIPMKRWQHFITSLRLDQRVDFEEGDIGLPGGAEGAVHWERFRDQFGAQRFVHNFCFNFASKRRSENLWPLEVATRFGLPRTIGSYGDSTQGNPLGTTSVTPNVQGLGLFLY